VLHQTQFRTNTPGVIGEVLDGEAIIVSLETGAYYSLNGVGAEVWTAAQAGTTLAAVIAWAIAHYAGEPAVIADGVTALVEELLGEGLLVAGGVTAIECAPVSALSAAGRPPFVRPNLEKYTDMADLLLLDPIHEVDAQGWPHPAPHV
jgi:hypothetical protein